MVIQNHSKSNGERHSGHNKGYIRNEDKIQNLVKIFYLYNWRVRGSSPKDFFEIYTEKLPSEQKKLQSPSSDEKKQFHLLLLNFLPPPLPVINFRSLNFRCLQYLRMFKIIHFNMYKDGYYFMSVYYWTKVHTYWIKVTRQKFTWPK